MSQPGKLLFLMWVSWAGKNTILRLLAQRHDNYTEIISYKSRPLRPWEIDGKDYHYMSEEDFEKAIHEWIFLEYAKVHNTYYYGTKKSDILDGLAAGKILLKEIDMQWVKHLSDIQPDIYASSLRIFMDLDEETMIQRITSRAPISPDELQKRLQSAAVERELAHTYATHIVSAKGSIEEVYERVEQIIKNSLE